MSTVLRTTIARCFGLALCAMAACSPTSMVEVQSPSTVVDPSVVATPAGATQLYNFAVSHFAVVFGGGVTTTGAVPQINFVGSTALLTDEGMRTAISGVTQLGPGMDERQMANSSVPNSFDSDVLYLFMHEVRNEPRQARQALQLYAPATPAAWQGQLSALEAYATLWFAEAFCSGIPLTVVPLSGTPQPTRGFTTQELYEHALTLFDSAITLARDSTRFVNLAKVGKGRALLGLGRFADAAAAVQGVPTDFTYTASYGPLLPSGAYYFYGNLIGTNPRVLQAVDQEGGTSLVWSADPRAAIVTTPTLSGAMRLSAKYSVAASGTLDATVAAPATPIRVADGLEARLIEAEADLANGGAAWLSTLNTLRSTCIGAAACAPVPGITAAMLPALADPGTPAARLDLLLKERAMWLYLTGHRQGDLRRLLHVYHRDPTGVYPSGPYINAGFPPNILATPTNGTTYGTDVVFPPRADEQTNNPLYGGCYDLNP